MKVAEAEDTSAARNIRTRMKAGETEIHEKGKTLSVPSTQIDGRTVIRVGRWLKVASVRHEELLEGSTVEDPERFLQELAKSALHADLFTFAERIPKRPHEFAYKTEWESVAAVDTTSYAKWWKEKVEYSIRKAVNRSKKAGIDVRIAEFDEELVTGVHKIYNDVPVRQGKDFWHYGKDLDTVRADLSDYLDRSVFLGAYLEGALIGFMKITWVGPTGTITQILSLTGHFDKRPNNALIAKAIEVCEAFGKSYLIYGNYVYYDPNSSLTEFKRRNGFESISLPRYYIPLTMKGKIALAIGLHRQIPEMVPKPVFRLFLNLRRRWKGRRLKGSA